MDASGLYGGIASLPFSAEVPLFFMFCNETAFSIPLVLLLTTGYVQVSSDSVDTNIKDNFKDYTKVFSFVSMVVAIIIKCHRHLHGKHYLQELRTEADLEMIGNKKAKEVDDDTI